MADSLFDFNKFMGSMIQLGNLREEQRRNSLYEMDVQRRQDQYQSTMDLRREELEFDREKFKTQSELQAEDHALRQQNAALEQQRIIQSSAFRALDEIEKMKKDPAIAMNRSALIDLTTMQGQLLKRGLGMDVPMPSKEEMMGGYEEVSNFVQTMRDPEASEQDKYAAATNIVLANPTYGKQLLEDMKKAGDVSFQMNELSTRLELNKTKLQAMNIQMGRVKRQENELTEHLGGVSRSLAITEDPRFKPHFAKIMSFKDHNGDPNRQAIAGYLALHPDFKSEVEKELQNDRANLPVANQLMDIDINAKSRAYQDFLNRNQGQDSIEQREELAMWGIIQSARRAQANWVENPFDPKALVATKKGLAGLKLEAGLRGKKSQEINDQRNSFAQEKFDRQTQAQLATTMVEEQFLTNIKAGMGDNEAALKAIQETGKRYPGIPIDTSKIQNLEKKGKLELGITTGTRQDAEKRIINYNMVQGTIGQLRQVVEENPTAVGAVGNMKRFLGGIAQQTFDAARSSFSRDKNIDPNARGRIEQMLANTDPEDEIQSLTIGLTYNIARELSGTGALSNQDLDAAEKMVGGLKNSSGSRQFLNHLKVIEDQMRRRAEMSSEMLSTGKLPAVGSGGGQAVPQSEAIEQLQSAEDYLKAIGIPVE
jgi:hypothetical protein